MSRGLGDVYKRQVVDAGEYDTEYVPETPSMEASPIMLIPVTLISPEGVGDTSKCVSKVLSIKNASPAIIVFLKVIYFIIYYFVG